ncbi:MAG TPA: hypothetical protein VMT57_05385 [Candidatus Thermoplasmatota archaeon]|nr:hypothetical protein [Candidatus Thermoplasmatota archaeon]
MKKFLAVQITALLIISGTLGGMLYAANAFEEVRDRIVLVLCLSCIKLEPKTTREFTFNTVNNVSHPRFVLENLSKGPVFLHFSETVCSGCEVMFPIVKSIFGVKFGKQDRFWRTVTFENQTITYIYSNLDNTTDTLENTFPLYDKDDIGGLPMFVIVTLGYDHGTVRPYYTTLYGTLNVPTDTDRDALLREVLHESLELYKQNKAGYHVPP